MKSQKPQKLLFCQSFTYLSRSIFWALLPVQSHLLFGYSLICISVAVSPSSSIAFTTLPYCSLLFIYLFPYQVFMFLEGKDQILFIVVFPVYGIVLILLSSHFFPFQKWKMTFKESRNDQERSESSHHQLHKTSASGPYTSIYFAVSPVTWMNGPCSQLKLPLAVCWIPPCLPTQEICFVILSLFFPASSTAPTLVDHCHHHTNMSSSSHPYNAPSLSSLSTLPPPKKRLDVL